MRVFAAGMVCLALAGCDSPNFRTSQFQFGSAQTLAATGNLRFVSERRRDFADGSAQQVACTEPSPDYATAATTAVDISAKSAVAEAPIEAQGKVNVAEAITKLDGRSKGVLALRDDLYAACQAYTNGQIGKDAYSVILSQYGQLLVALMNETTGGTALAAGDASALAAMVRQQREASAFAAVLVACINGNDPTRATHEVLRPNTLLTPDYCRRVMRRAGRIS
jgi:hypothetical protein